MRYRRFISVLLPSLLLGALSQVAKGDVIVGYESVGNTAALSPHAAPFVTGMDLTFGTGLAQGASSSDYDTSGWDNQADDFLQWGFSDTSVGSWDLTTVQLATQGSPGAPSDFRLDVITSAGTTSFGPLSTGILEFNVGSISQVKSATFRLFGTSGSGGNVQLPSAYNVSGSMDLVVNGTFNPVPEPGSLMICGLAAVPVLLRRGRR